MIINRPYFSGEIYIPNAVPGIADEVTKVTTELDMAIEDYARECLLKCLGNLFYEFEAQLNSDKATGLNDGADAKWDYLLNGTTYTDPDSGQTVTWRGIRYKSSPSQPYNRSFLAYYVYFFYESNDYITRSEVGNQIESAKNATTVSPSWKVSKAWNKFVTLVQGEVEAPDFLINQYGLGVDWLAVAQGDVSLYKFINDTNRNVPDTYENFEPKTWERINHLNI